MRVLIVDDEQPFLLGLKQYLEEPPIDVDTAETVREAITNLEQFHYDFAILDIRLTGTLNEDGVEILKYIKDENNSTKVIILTGFGTPEIMRKVLSLGADYYFEKPLAPAILENILRNKKYGCGDIEDVNKLS